MSHRIDGKAKLYGVIGYPVTHSLSPVIHSCLMEKFGLDAAYIPLGVAPDRFDIAIAGLKAIGVAGSNVTLPYKIEIVKHLSSIEEEARLIGAVNTITREEGGAYRGANTDCLGFARMLAEKIDASGKEVLLIGAGGAARGVVVGLAKLGVSRIRVVDIMDGWAAKLVGQFTGTIPSRIEAIAIDTMDLREFQIIVNASSVGVAHSMDEGATAAFFKQIFATRNDSALFYDINYSLTGTTAFQKMVETENYRAIHTGLDMLIYQAFESFLIWNPGLSLEFPAMRDEIVKEIASRF